MAGRVRKRPGTETLTPVWQVSTVTAPPLPHDPRPEDLPGCTLLTLPRDLDLGNCADLLAAVTRVVAERAGLLHILVLDLSGTAFMDSRGVRLIDDVRALLAPGTELRLVAVPDSLVLRMLTLTGLRRDVPVYDDLAEAVTGTCALLGERAPGQDPDAT
ncbi:anti-sigma factor antagonist [Streptomyces griseoaurantiacus]|nr:anti-sigma factor antagonist [Streptomyces griseoaurantiacus]